MLLQVWIVINQIIKLILTKESQIILKKYKKEIDKK